MTQFGFASYIITAVFYAILGLLLCTSWRGRMKGGLLLTVVLVSELWAAAGAFAGSSEYLQLKHFLALEVVRNAIWSAMIWQLLSYTKLNKEHHWKNLYVLGYLELALVTIVAELFPAFGAMLKSITLIDFRILSHVVQAIVGLFLVEQLFRNTRLELRWTIKLLCLGAGVMFLYDFVLYSEALLFGRIDPDLWDARGIVNAFVVPMVAISAARNPHWSVDIFVSRSMVYHTTALLATGIYLLLMATVGYYIREFGGSWGRVAQVVFVVISSLILLLMITSGRIRASVKVFFNQHFFTYKYDYRDEWLKLNRTLAAGESEQALREGCIKVLLNIVDSGGGALWIKQEDGKYRISAECNVVIEQMKTVDESDSLVTFLRQRQWVIELPEYLQTPELYEGLNLYEWQDKVPMLWLVVPLIQQGKLYGFIALVQPQATRDINWEDHDLLKTVGQQLANYLALMDTSDALANARQFEAYNRLSAFIVHDLKNLVAQLSLVVKNAEKHKRNPAFIDDVVDTLANSVDKMNRLLGQLRKGNVIEPKVRTVNMKEILELVVKQQNKAKPKPKVVKTEENMLVSGDQDKLVSILGHLVQNAQEATPENGSVSLSLYKLDSRAIIEVTDTGCGMDSRFIRERLFRPFDTTKGNAGMGIGVFEARQLVTTYGGQMEVESEPNKGTRFTLRLPLAKQALENKRNERDVV